MRQENNVYLTNEHADTLCRQSSSSNESDSLEELTISMEEIKINDSYKKSSLDISQYLDISNKNSPVKKLQFDDKLTKELETLPSTATKSQRGTKFTIKIKYTQKEFYEGEVDENYIINGYGTYHYENGDIYEGEFEDGLKCGQGEYLYYNGSIYRGMWLDDKKHGEGLYRFDNYDINGEWKDDNVINGFTYKINKFEKVSDKEESSASLSPKKFISQYNCRGYTSELTLDQLQKKKKDMEEGVNESILKTYNINIDLIEITSKGNQEIETRNIYNFIHESEIKDCDTLIRKITEYIL